ncbi:MAG: cell division ATPase MinD [archaeon]
MTLYIGLVSGKGGVGKTTTAINLGSALNYFNRDVTIVDGNLSTPNIGVHLGVPVVPINLHHVIQGKHHIKEALYAHPTGTKIVPAGISLDDIRNTTPDGLGKAVKHLDGMSDIVIIDGAAGLGREALATISAVDQVIVITNPEMPAITDALKTIKMSEALGKKVLGVVLTRTKPNNMDVALKNIETMLEKPILGIIPEDKSVREALVRRDAVVYTHPKSNAAVAYKKLAANLIGQEYTETVEVNGGFLKKIMRKMGLA